MITFKKWPNLLVLISVLTLCSIAAACTSADRTVAKTPSESQLQVQRTLQTQLHDPEVRKRYLVSQQFMDLYGRMPMLEQAYFGPSVRVSYWRSVKWVIEATFVSQKGTIYVDLAFARGTGLTESYTARLVGGQYVGRVPFDWTAVSSNPAFRSGYAPANMLPITCRDVRARTTQFAAIGADSGGPTVLKSALRAASAGVSALPGTALACYRFAGLNLVELALGADGVLYRLDGVKLIPLARGFINYADAGGRFMIIRSAAVGSNEDDLPMYDYLEVIPIAR